MEPMIPTSVIAVELHENGNIVARLLSPSGYVGHWPEIRAEGHPIDVSAWGDVHSNPSDVLNELIDKVAPKSIPYALILHDKGAICEARNVTFSTNHVHAERYCARRFNADSPREPTYDWIARGTWLTSDVEVVPLEGA